MPFIFTTPLPSTFQVTGQCCGNRGNASFLLALSKSGKITGSPWWKPTRYESLTWTSQIQVRVTVRKKQVGTSFCLLSGNYTCEVEWIGSPISITHKLTVLVPPSIVAVLPGGMGQVDHPIEAREGSQVRLECRAEGIPPPIVRWRNPVST